MCYSGCLESYVLFMRRRGCRRHFPIRIHFYGWTWGDLCDGKCQPMLHTHVLRKRRVLRELKHSVANKTCFRNRLPDPHAKRNFDLVLGELRAMPGAKDYKAASKAFRKQQVELLV